MACACKKGSGLRNTMGVRNRAGNIIRPTGSGPVSAQGGPAAAPTPTALRAAAIPTSQRSSSGELQEKKKTQRIRRDAIRKALNK